MTQLLTALSICICDWVVASRAMAYTTQLVLDDVSPPAFNAKGPKWLPFYERQWGKHDFFHIMGWPRYLALGWFAYLGFGMDWRWYAATALLNAAGWLSLKILHGKLDAWGWKPRWMQ